MNQPATKVRAIITGASGMVGEGVLHECLLDPAVKGVLVVGRKPCGHTHSKLKEIIHKDFLDLSPIADQLSGYNTCFFCLGVSSVGMKEADYYQQTHTLTMHFAETLVTRNPGMTFCYVSGAGTDSSEKGRLMWARVKGKTENDLMKLPFKAAYNFRPGFILPKKGLKNVLPAYKYLNWLYPILKRLMPGKTSTLKAVGLAMIRVATRGYEKQILEVKDF